MERVALVGFTGFVGSNLYEKGKFEAAYNTKNITEAFGTRPDLLVYAGIRAEKYLANSMPEKDMDQIKEAEKIIDRIRPKRVVLISTIDVFKNPVNVDEDSEVITEGLHAYGLNRYRLELWVRENYPDSLVVRLPGLFGKNIKKNFIYDYINIVPSMLKTEKLEELLEKEPQLARYYQNCGNGFYKVQEVSDEDRIILKRMFETIGFSALNFTDSRSEYQFYNLQRLWGDIQTAIHAGLTLWHPATEPVSAGGLYEFLTGHAFLNEISAVPARYNYRTRFSEIYGGKDGYIMDRGQVLEEIKGFVEKTIYE